MASQISVQKIVEPNSWLVLGAPAATSVILLNDTTLTYSDGTSDVLPANTEALLVGGGTSFNRQDDVHILFTYKGDNTLRVEKESRLYLLTQDYAPLGRILHGEIVPYQPVPALLAATLLTGSWSGGALVGAGRAVAGGGYYGLLNSQSVRGGGSVSGIGFRIQSSAGNSAYDPVTVVSGFLKIASAPGGDTTVFDMNAGSGGYMRLKLTSARHLVAETSLAAMPNAGTIDLGAIGTGVWNWWSVTYITPYGGQLWLTAAVTPQGLPTGGAQNSSNLWTGGSPNSSPITLTATFGLGVHQSSGYADAPASGWEFSKVVIDQYSSASTGNFLRAPLTADMAANAMPGEYMCRQSIGAIASLTDTGTNGANLVAGPNGLTVVADGPYA